MVTNSFTASELYLLIRSFRASSLSLASRKVLASLLDNFIFSTQSKIPDHVLFQFFPVRELFVWIPGFQVCLDLGRL